LFEGVKILAINRNYTQSRVDRSSNHVTLELTQPQANIVVLARDRGNLTLTYNPGGKGDGGLVLTSDERVTLYEILGLKKQDPAKDPFLTEIYRGVTRSAHQFDDKGRFVGNGNTGAAPNNGPQYVLPNNPTNYGSPSTNPSQDTDRSNVPAPNANQPAPPVNNPAPSRAPTASLPLPLQK
jgi:pilus assembly protein CpaB